MEQFDFVEVFNACESEEVNEKARKLARKYHKPGFGGSDAHRLECIGMAYTKLPDNIRCESDLIKYVKSVSYITCGGTRYDKTTKDKLGPLINCWWNRSLYIIKAVNVCAGENE